MNTTKYTYTTINEVRNGFWETFPEFERGPKSKRQNDYPADVRTTFVDWVDAMAKDGLISENLAQKVTL